MRIWLLKDSEPLPLTPAVKPMRVAMLTDALLRRGHEVHWWCSTMSHFKKQREAAAGSQPMAMPSGTCTVHRVEAGLYRRNLSLARVRHHRRLAKQWRAEAEQVNEKPDVILVAYPLIEWVRTALDYGEAHSIPVIVDVRDQWPDTFIHYVRPLYRPLVRILVAILYPNVASLFRRPQAVTSMSAPVLQWALAKAVRTPGEDTRVFYLGTPLTASESREPRAEPTGRTMRCVFIGTLGHTADVLTIAHAARLLHEAGEDVSITIAGDGDRMKEIREAVAGIPGVEVPGWCGSAQVDSILAGADVALLTGHNEAMPNKFFDYVAAGLPIICSLRGEVREYIDRNKLGVCCPSGDAKALAAAISSMRQHYAVHAQAVASVPVTDYASKVIYGEFTSFIERLGQK